MLDYIIKVLLFQTLFLAVYDLFLKRETFFQWNRVYLMATSVLAYIIPKIKVNSVQEIIPQEYVVMLPEVILNPTAVIEQQFDWSILFFLVLKVIFWFGVVVATLMFAYKLYQIIDLIRTNDKEITSNYYLVWLKNNKAFSFFNYIFLGKESNNKAQIIEHELVHVKQKHSLDLLFFELQKIVCWFNPYSYLYQGRISELHEFIADSKAIKVENKSTYFNNLLAETFGVQNISFINPFFKKLLLKKRILMLKKSKSKQILKFKYVLLIPILSGMLLYSSCASHDSSIVNNITLSTEEDNFRNSLIEVVENRVKNGNASADDLRYIKEMRFSPMFFKSQTEDELLNRKEKFVDIVLNQKRQGERWGALYPNKSEASSMTLVELNGFILSQKYKELTSDDIPKILKIINDSVRRHEVDRQLVMQKKVDNYLINKRKGSN